MAAPYMPQDIGAVSTLTEALEKGNKDRRKGGFSCKKTTFEVKNSRDGLTVDSWRMQDWDYKRSNLPTYARGLFTFKNRRNQPEIAVRGYDKFFNVGEVNSTKWTNIISNTQPPYELTLKENGCIIFIAGLPDDTLLVCSKHSTGDRADITVSHASAGEKSLEKQLQAVGKTKEDLARELRARNVTAVAELCDDSFEEHILAYGPDKAGLYLHGMNLNVPEFATYPSPHVQAFADTWGFVKTGLITMNNVQEVKSFLDEVAETGAHDGRDVEGFVVRCRMSNQPDTAPYQDWFFKYKFEEPYLMYRQWRECTKAIIAGKPPKFKKHAKITNEYLQYVRMRLAQDPQLGKEYNQNHGIIALRDDFLKYKNLNGADAANLEDTFSPATFPGVSKDIVISPIATIGCGKTTIALALTHLFGWGHIQNDNISGKQRPPRFVKAVMDQLKSHPVVFADRNNASKHERKQLITDVKNQQGSVKIVCLHYTHDEEAMDQIRKITQERVLSRGDNHQTIHAASDKNKFIGVMEGFLNRLEPCMSESPPDNGFDAVIGLNPTAESRKNLETVVSELIVRFPDLIPQPPTSDQLDDAINVALGYRPDFKHTIPDRGPKLKSQPGAKQQSKPRRLEYMSIDLPTASINSLLDTRFKQAEPATSKFYQQLKQTRRVQPKFHVTLMHRNGAQQHPDIWSKYTALHGQTQDDHESLGECDVMLERAVFDDRIMAIVVRLVDENAQWTCVNQVAHVTIGTRDASVKPKESNDLLGKWLQGDTTANLQEVVFEEKPTLKGTVKAVSSK